MLPLNPAKQGGKADERLWWAPNLVRSTERSGQLTGPQPCMRVASVGSQEEGRTCRTARSGKSGVRCDLICREVVCDAPHNVDNSIQSATMPPFVMKEEPTNVRAEQGRI